MGAAAVRALPLGLTVTSFKVSASGESSLPRTSRGISLHQAAPREQPPPHGTGASDPFKLFIQELEDYAIYTLDPAGRVTSWNKGAERIKGYSASEVMGEHVARFYLPEDVARGKPEEDLRRALADGRFEDQTLRLRKGDVIFHAHVVVTPIRGPGGEHLGFGKVTRDITSRQRAEQERVALATREQSVRAREEFLTLAAHELRTPVAALQLQADLVLRQLASESCASPRIEESVTRMRQSADRLRRLVDAVLRMPELDVGELELHCERVELGGVLDSVLEDHGEEIARSGCTVRLEGDRRASVSCDRAFVELLLGNLLSNALKYGPGKPVTVVLSRAGSRVRVTIRDEGIGIAPEHQARIFHRFERACSARNYGGIGLGLWTARRIAEAHGGGVRVTSVPGEGALFEVDLPAGDAARE